MKLILKPKDNQNTNPKDRVFHEVKDLSIIIPSFNTKKLLINCLNSIIAQTKTIKYELIVVDNASTDGSVEAIKKFNLISSKTGIKFKIIVNKENLGFAKANNQALKIAKGEYILFLNSDTVIVDKAIEKSLKFVREQKNVDILGCQLLNQNQSLQPSAGYYPKLRRVFYMMFFLDDIKMINRLIKPYQQSNLEFYQKNHQVDWVTGAFLLVKRRVIDKIGDFDEEFFMYGEEVDFCFRAIKKGFKVWFYSNARVIHLKGKSSINGFEKAVLGEFQGLKKFYKKHVPKWELMVLRILLRIGALFRIIVFGILWKDSQKRIVYEKAFNLA